MNYNDYGFARMEVWLVLGGLIALGLLCGVVMTLGGQWARIIVTAGLLTLFVDFQFDWLDKQPEFRVPAFGIGMLLLSWVLRTQLSRIAAPVFATMLVATLVLPVLRRTRTGPLVIPVSAWQLGRRRLRCLRSSCI